MNNLITHEDLAKKLGIAKHNLLRLCYVKGSTLKYKYINGVRWFNEEEVLEMLKKGG